MKNFLKKSFVINLILLAVVVFVGARAASLVWDAVALSRESDVVEQQIEELLQKKQELETRIVELETEQAVRREAKERLNLKNPGEEVVVVVPDPPPQEDAAASEGLWNTLKRFFTQ